MNIYKVMHAPIVLHAQHAPQVTIYQMATMLAHQKHAEELKNDKTGKYKWYDESLITIPQFIHAIVDMGRAHAAEGKDMAMLIVGQVEHELAQWPIDRAIAVRASTAIYTGAEDKCRAYQQALNNYWMDMETGMRLEQRAPDLADYLYPRIGYPYDHVGNQ